MADHERKRRLLNYLGLGVFRMAPDPSDLGTFLQGSVLKDRLDPGMFNASQMIEDPADPGTYLIGVTP